MAANITVAKHGLVEGEGTEALLARASFHLENGALDKAIDSVRRIEGDTAEACVDWLKMAQRRLIVESAIKLISAHVTTLAATLS